MHPLAERLQEQIDAEIAAGTSIDVIEEQIIEPAPLSPDQRAALWLYAWCLRNSGRAGRAPVTLAASGLG